MGVPNRTNIGDIKPGYYDLDRIGITTYAVLTYLLKKTQTSSDSPLIEHNRTSQTRSPPIGCAVQNATPLTFDPKPSKLAFSTVLFPNFEYRPEVAGNVISGVAVQ